ncbi:MAG: hypothetical protein ACRDT8_10020, partial [Micromonosporaceae bacterium]
MTTPPTAAHPQVDNRVDPAPNASAAEAKRPCAHCGEEFSYQRSASRPPKYCSRTWPEPPHSCQARAKAQRIAAKAVGLDAPLAAYQQAGERVVPAIEALQHELTEHLSQVREVQTAALARIAEAEREASQALERAAACEAAQARAEAAQEAAEQGRVQALEARRAAEQAAQEAQQDRDTQVKHAWETVTQKEAERAAALATAREQAAAAAQAGELRQAEAQRAEKLAAANHELSQFLAAARAEVQHTAAAARADIQAVRDELSQLRQQHAAQLEQRDQKTTLDLGRLQQERDAERERVGQLRAELEAEQRNSHYLASQLHAAHAAAEAAKRHAEVTDQRYEQLVRAFSPQGQPAIT